MHQTTNVLLLFINLLNYIPQKPALQVIHYFSFNEREEVIISFKLSLRHTPYTFRMHFEMMLNILVSMSLTVRSLVFFFDSFPMCFLLLSVYSVHLYFVFSHFLKSKTFIYLQHMCTPYHQ